MRYMMFIKHTEDYRKEDVPASLYEEMGKFIEETSKSGNFVGGAGLEPSSAGARVRLKRGTITVTDGPFAESKESIGGYFLLTVPSMDEAVAIAQQCPGLPYGIRVEVRPVAGECPIAEVLRSEKQLAHA